MEHETAVRKINEAEKLIDEAVRLTGETDPAQAAHIFAAVAQAKLLAVIASALTEMQATAEHENEQAANYALWRQ